MRGKSPKNRYGINRVLRAEALESRALMASDVAHNFLMPHDVNDDGNVSPIDALVVINRLNRNDDSPGGEREFQDVDDDSRLTPLDALSVINDLNSQSTRRNQETYQASNVAGVAHVRARVELETEGLETELKIRVDNAPASQSFGVSLNDLALGQLTTDSRGRGELVLSRGDDNRNHLQLPDSLTVLSPEMELVIGDIVRGTVTNVARVEGGTTAPENNDDSSSRDSSLDDSSSDDSSSDDSSSNDSNSTSSNLNLVARFSVVAGVQRSAEYEQETEHGTTKRKLKAEIEKASPNATYEVSLDGQLVGKIITNNRGKGSLRLTTHPNDTQDVLLPSDFPQVGVGTIVTIGLVSAPLQ